MDEPTVGLRIRLERTSQRMPQKELAWRVGISVTALSQIENEHTRPSVPHLAKVASALGVTSDYLLGLEHPAG